MFYEQKERPEQKKWKSVLEKIMEKVDRAQTPKEAFEIATKKSEPAMCFPYRS